MADFISAIFEGLAAVIEILSSIVASFFRTVFSKRTLNENGDPESNATEYPTSRWHIFAYSMIGAALLSVVIGAVCFVVWKSFKAAQWGATISAVICTFGAIKAAAK